MDGQEESPSNPPPPSEELDTSVLGRIRRAGSVWLGGGGAMIPPPAEDINSSLNTSVVHKRGRPPKTPTTPTFQVLSPSGGDEEPGPSTLGPSRLAVTAPGPPRKFVSPTSPTPPTPSSRSDANATAINWLLDNIKVADNPATTILKSQLMDRYTAFCEEKGLVPLVDSVLGKRVRECFPAVTTKRPGVGTRADAINIMREVVQKGKNIIGRNHPQTLEDLIYLSWMEAKISEKNQSKN
ncbi:Transcription factor RFX3 [Folsomia candida]|uniref:Transcription factor RFX3 n=1 Tax=Folsomia candida TaxID=158441 RepID=A0A226EBU8_FOLCA|nr:Transcription factor RFX3 [Folsomia candida]